ARALPFAHSVAVVLIAFRLLQNLALFLLAAAYYRRLGIPVYAALIGLSILAWSISYSYYDADVQFNTWFDVSFYLAAALAIMARRDWLILPITILAALNRETGGLVPMMLLAARFTPRPGALLRDRSVWIGVASLAAYGGIFVLLRLI